MIKITDEQKTNEVEREAYLKMTLKDFQDVIRQKYPEHADQGKLFEMLQLLNRETFVDEYLINPRDDLEDILPSYIGIKTTAETIKAQLAEINKDTEGVLVIKYGTPEFMVSGRAATKISEKIIDRIKPAYPNLGFLLLPWYIELEYLDIEELMKMKE